MKKLIILSLVLLLNYCSTTPESKDREVYYVQIGDAYLPVYTLGTTPNPEKVILFVHGGPGLSSIFYSHIPFFQKLAKEYKMFFWDQRGAGGSRGRSDKSSMTIKQFVKDMDVVYDSIKAKLPNAKIYVMGHSYGGMVGGAYVTQYNDKVEASLFIEPAFNVGQINQIASELMLNNITEYLKKPLDKKEEKYWTDAKIFYEDHKKINARVYLTHSRYVSAWDKVHGRTEMGEFMKSYLGELMVDNILEDLSVFIQLQQVLVQLEDNGEDDRNLSTDPVFGLTKITRPMLLVTSQEDFMVPPVTSIDGYNHLNGGVPNPKSEHVSFANASHDPFVQPVKNDLFDKVTNFMHNN
jgi:pimeloyl-ACP methyl ester carboxylesterase